MRERSASGERVGELGVATAVLIGVINGAKIGAVGASSVTARSARGEVGAAWSKVSESKGK